MEQKFDNAMRRQVYSIPELITQQYDLMEPRIREALSFSGDLLPPAYHHHRMRRLDGCGNGRQAGIRAVDQDAY